MLERRKKKLHSTRLEYSAGIKIHAELRSPWRAGENAARPREYPRFPPRVAREGQVTTNSSSSVPLESPNLQVKVIFGGS